jgi:hypothetical protein
MKMGAKRGKKKKVSELAIFSEPKLNLFPADCIRKRIMKESYV